MQELKDEEIDSKVAARVAGKLLHFCAEVELLVNIHNISQFEFHFDTLGHVYSARFLKNQVVDVYRHH